MLFVLIGLVDAANAFEAPGHVENNAALAALPPTVGRVFVREGYATAGDGGGATYIGSTSPCALNGGVGDNGAEVAPARANGCWRIARQPKYDARIWGVTPDYDFAKHTGTDNTIALANAISYVETGAAQGVGPALELPDGEIMAGPQKIVGQIDLEGQGSYATTLVLKSGANAPMLTYLPDGYDFPGVGYPSGATYARNFRITSVDGYSANARAPDAAGISIARGAKWSLWAYFDDITIYNVPGDGVKAFAVNGFAYFKRPTITQVGGNGIDANSIVDWVIDGANVSLARGSANIKLSGTGQIYFHDLNSFAASGEGVWIYGASQVTFAGHTEINDNGKGGLYVSGSTAATYVSVSDFAGGGNSNAKVDTYGDVIVDVGAGGVMKIDRAQFPATHRIDPNNNSALNVQYLTGATLATTCIDCTFYGGAWNSSAVSNNDAYFTAFGGDGGKLTGTVNIATPNQYTGLIVSNGASPIGVIQGFSSKNDSGALALLSGGKADVFLCSNSGYCGKSYITGSALGVGTKSPDYPLDVAGLARADGLIANGAAPTLTGSCAAGAQTGGASAGTFKASASCSRGSVGLAFSFAAPSGFSCDFHNVTTPSNPTGSLANGDVIAWKCAAF